jgi:hypothetical protein
MIIRFAAVLGLLASLTVSAYGKSDMVLVEISGTSLKSPIEITDSRIQEFNIWAGPGVSVGDGVSSQREEREGFIIDWQAGVAAQRPSGPAACNIIKSRSMLVAGHVQIVTAALRSPVSLTSWCYLPSGQRRSLLLRKSRVDWARRP